LARENSLGGTLCDVNNDLPNTSLRVRCHNLAAVVWFSDALTGVCLSPGYVLGM